MPTGFETRPSPGNLESRQRAPSARQVRRAYFGGLLSGGGDAGGVELMAPFGLLESDDDGGIVVVVPGEVD
jgi:hypothetical protein